MGAAHPPGRVRGRRHYVIPAESLPPRRRGAGIQYRGASGCGGVWVPACAGTTALRHSRGSGNPVRWYLGVRWCLGPRLREGDGITSFPWRACPREGVGRESSTAVLPGAVVSGSPPARGRRHYVIPAEAGIQYGGTSGCGGVWVPACARATALRHSRGSGNPVPRCFRVRWCLGPRLRGDDGITSFPRKRESSTAVLPGAVVSEPLLCD